MNRRAALEARGASTAEVDRGDALIALAVLAAIVLGGGGSPAPLPEVVLQLALAGLFAAWLWLAPRGRLEAIPRAAWAIAALVLVLPALQLVPLPPALWHALPGRGTERAALALIGADGEWRAWSVDPASTLASLVAMVPPLLVMLMVSASAAGGRFVALAAIALGGVATLLLGAAQFTSGEGSAVRLYTREVPFLLGFQANHNSTADVLLIATIAALALVAALAGREPVPPRRPVVLGLAGAALALGGIGVVLTASRAGIALLAIAGLAALLLLRPWLGRGPRRLALAGAVLGLGAMALLALAPGGALPHALARFRLTGDLRPEIWRDSWFVARQYFPFGSGMGTFIPVFEAAERLEAVDPTITNRAHFDFLELLIEGGIPALMVLGAFAAILIPRANKALRGGSADWAIPALAGGLSLIVIALHSLVDYPLRSMALACVAGCCAGLLLTPRSVSEIPTGGPDHLQ